MSSLELYGAESSVFESAGASLAPHVRLAAIYVDLKDQGHRRRQFGPSASSADGMWRCLIS